MKPINNGQSALIHMQSRTWSVERLPGMCARGENRIMHFTSVDAFDGYVRAVRSYGYPVTFISPFSAVVEPRQ